MKLLTVIFFDRIISDNKCPKSQDILPASKGNVAV
jgi:hypothetical protein